MVGGGRARVAVRAWAAASAINPVIWAEMSLATLSLVYPWWIWVAGPWGVLLFARRVSQRRSVALGALDLTS